jgi:hypothetical protein
MKKLGRIFLCILDILLMPIGIPVGFAVYFISCTVLAIIDKDTKHYDDLFSGFAEGIVNGFRLKINYIKTGKPFWKIES